MKKLNGNAVWSFTFNFQMYKVYQGLRLNLSKISEMNMLGSLSTTFEVSSVFKAAETEPKYWLEPNIKPSNQVKLV